MQYKIIIIKDLEAFFMKIKFFILIVLVASIFVGCNEKDNNANISGELKGNITF